MPGPPAGRAGSGDAPPPPPPPPEKKSELSEPIHETVRFSLSIEIFQTTPFRKTKGFLKRCVYVKAKKHLLNFPSLGGRVPETEEIWRWQSCYVHVDVAVLRRQNSGRYHLAPSMHAHVWAVLTSALHVLYRFRSFLPAVHSTYKLWAKYAVPDRPRR